jgi:hypothetical protein
VPRHRFQHRSVDLANPVPAAAHRADAVTNATYAADGTEGFDDVGEYGLSTMRSCRNWVRQIDRAVLESVPWHERLRRYFTDWG